MERGREKISSKDFREYPFRPIVGVGAVVIHDGQLLLIKRLNEPGAGKWTIPGGVVELGEGLEDAARREVWEECGIKINIQRLAGIVERVIRDDQDRIRYHYVIVDYLAQNPEGNLRAGSDVAEAAWVPVDGLDTYDLTSGLKEFLSTVLMTPLQTKS